MSLTAPIADGDAQTEGVESARREIHRLVNELREEEDAAKKKDLAKQLEEGVTKVFNEDLQAREAELKKLEERLQKLRSQLEKRRQAGPERRGHLGCSINPP